MGSTSNQNGESEVMYSIENDDNDNKINLLSSEILKKIEEQVKHDREHRFPQTNIDNSYSSKNFGYICTAESNIPYSIKLTIVSLLVNL